LNHFKFRQLQAKCAVKGKSLCASAAATCSPVRSARTALVGTRTPLSIYCALCALDRCKSSSEICITFLPDYSGRLERGRQQCREQSLTDCSV